MSKSLNAPADKRAAEAKVGAGALQLTAVEAQLAEESKAAILAAGISASYFNKHFQLASVVNRPGDQRIVWRYSINGYETTVNDTVGYYTTPTGKRVNQHAIKDTLAAAHDIERTITRRQAERALRACIGAHDSASVVFGVSAIPGHTTLNLTATSRSRPRHERRNEARERAAQAQRAPKRDPNLDRIEEGDEGGEGPPLYVGFVNLETGRCTKGRAIAIN